MRIFLFACLSVWVALSASVQAQDRVTLGKGRLFTNDVLGDGQDRWRTGSYTLSVARGANWDGSLPGRMGDLIEYRFRMDLIAPANIVTPAAGDRRYAGALSFGVHTHFQAYGAEISLGGDLVVTGPQTGVGDLHSAVHSVLGVPEPAVLGAQIGNGIHPTLTFEVGRTFELSPVVAVRPFVEVIGGIETLARIGGDVHIGRLGRQDLMLRDAVTGHRYRATRAAGAGFYGVLGADIAHVAHSTYLPATGGYSLTDARTRVRVGVQWQGERAAAFYGLTWLGEEFDAQPEGQILGSVRLHFEF